LGWKSNLTLDAAIELSCRALWQAAEADSATGGYDPVRGIFPSVATIDARGFVFVEQPKLSGLFTNIAEEVRNV